MRITYFNWAAASAMEQNWREGMAYLVNLAKERSIE